MSSKKNTKIETPIDQRETFVSIQKSFADSDVNVEEKLKTLYELQKTDNAIDQILQLRGDLPTEVEQLEEEIAQINKDLEDCNIYIEGMNTSIAENKKNLLEYEQQAAAYKAQLDTVSNSREFDSINKEIENINILRDIAQKHINEAKYNIVERKDMLEDINNALEDSTADLQAKKAELDSIVDSTSKDEQALIEKRNKLVQQVDARTMSAYERIRESVKNHLAVVAVFNEDSCGGCFNTIIPQRLIEIASNKKLIICEHCGRIIVNPNFSE